jgi:TonB family protein
MSEWNEIAWFSFLTSAAVKGTGVLAAAWLAAKLLRGRSAAARHLVWTAAFAAILVLPFLSAALPALRMPVEGAALPSAIVAFVDAAAPADAGAAQSKMPAGAVTIMHQTRWRSDFKTWLIMLWAAGVFVSLGRTLLAYAAAWRTRRSAMPFPVGDLHGALAHELGIRQPVDLLQIEAGSMPMTLGLRRAAILMPADAVLWSAERRRIVLLHELAHVRRGEAVSHLLARAAMSLYWWNPLAWTAWREFLKERERAADDLVLNAGARASDYAGHLLDVARTMQARSVVAWAAACMARRSQLEGSVLSILNSGVDRSAPSRATMWAAALLAAAMILPLAAVRAQDRQTQDKQSQEVPADIDAAIRVAKSQQNYETLEAAAQAATQSRNYDVAQRLLEAALEIRAEKAGPQSVEYAVGLVKLGELEQKRNPKSHKNLYAEAARMLGDRPEAAPALTHMGVDALANKDYPHAFEYFQHAQQVDPAHAGIALMWMAVVRQHEKQTDEADRLYRSALAAQDPKTGDAVLIMRVYSQFLKVEGRDDEANELEARVKATQRTNAQPEPPLREGVFHVGKGVTPPVPVKRGEPDYTDEARLAKLQGTVVLRLVIGIDGRAHETQVVRELGLGLDENAIEAIGQWQFKPATKDGQPVPVRANIEVNFRLL